MPAGRALPPGRFSPDPTLRVGGVTAAAIVQAHNLQRPRFGPPTDITDTDAAERELDNFDNRVYDCEVETAKSDVSMSAAILAAGQCDLHADLMGWMRDTRLHLERTATGIRRLRRRGFQWLRADDPDNSPPPPHSDLKPNFPVVLPGQVSSSGSEPTQMDLDRLAKALDGTRHEIGVASSHMSMALLHSHRFGMSDDEIEWLREAQRRMSAAETGALLLTGWLHSIRR